MGTTLFHALRIVAEYQRLYERKRVELDAELQKLA